MQKLFDLLMFCLYQSSETKLARGGTTTTPEKAIYILYKNGQ